LHTPSFLLLDEPSARLDPATEAILTRAMRQALTVRTSVVIAHRAKILECVDDLLLLEDGTIREYGPRTMLAADPHSAFSHIHAEVRR
jgi:ABC-type bacteriocin/lantibiotic exporter with double-glycine peptidase domain